jgi:hypothetical protein
LKTDIKLAKDDPSVETITFDLEKTLPFYHVYRRILSFIKDNFGYTILVYTLGAVMKHCNVWVEGEAGRGAQEVGSCLVRHIGERLDSSVKRLILWSDSYRGQNRNIKLF